MNIAFNKWLDVFIAEKRLDLETIIEAKGPSGMNYIPLANLLGAIKAAPRVEQKAIQMMIIRIDFKNGDVMDYFKHLAKAIAL